MPNLAKYTAEYVNAEATKLEQFWSDRTRHIRDIWDVMNLTDVNNSNLFESLVDNEPKVMLDMATHLLAQLPHRTRILVNPDDEQAMAKAGKSERAILSIWRAVNEDRQLSGPFKAEYVRLMLLSGWRHTRYWLSDKGTPFCVVNDNPLQAFPRFAGDKLVGYVHRYEVSSMEAKDIATQYGIVDGKLSDSITGRVVISDYYELDMTDKPAAVNCIVWSETTNATRGGYLKAPAVIAGRDSLPIICGPVGGFPDRTRAGWQGKAGSSFLDANLELYKQGNKWLSAYAQFAKEQARPIMLYRDIELPDKADAAAVQDLRSREGLDIEAPTTGAGNTPAIQPIQVQVNTDLLNVLFQYMAGMRQRGTFPYITFGGITQELSGFAITQLFKAIFYKVGAFLDAQNADFRRIEKDWLLWARDSGKDITLSISGVKELGGRRVPSEEPWSAKDDIPEGSFDVVVEQRLNLPDTLAQKIATARTAMPGNSQLLDLYTIVDEILEFDDPVRMVEGVRRDEKERDEKLVRQFKENKLKARQFRAAGDEDSMELAELYEGIAAAIFTQMTGRPPGQAPQINQGMSATALPGEAQGVSPDAARALMGTNRGAPNVRA